MELNRTNGLVNSKLKHKFKKFAILSIYSYLYTYKTLIILIVCLFEAVRTFENSRAMSTCYDSY